MSTATQVINFRAPQATRALIDRAAEVSGKNRTEFILQASCEKAQTVLADQTHFSLSEAGLKRFNELLDAPLPATSSEALRKLLQTKSPWER